MEVVAPDAPATRPALPATQPADDPDAEVWQAIAQILGTPGVLRDHVYTVTIPRDDLHVDIEGMPVPTAAGIATELRFYRCPCGKMVVVGQFCLAEYELNDVIDSLRQGHVTIASTAPLFLYAEPRLVVLRFQGEGKAGPLADVLREALTWTGKARTEPPR